MPSAVPNIARVDSSDIPKLIQTIERDGGVIVTNFTTKPIIDKVNAETQPWLDNDKPWQGALFPPETRRCTRLVGRSKTVRENWLTHPTLTAVTDHFLCKTTKNWYDQERHTYTSYPVLSISLTMDVRPGGKGQRLHRDNKVFHWEHTDRTATGYEKESDVSMGILVPGVKVTVDNGATAVCYFPSSCSPLHPLTKKR
jgi:ectoine hydroxylase-related dioxygenase (phytanoyl-CoA dioxygenase family)